MSYDFTIGVGVNVSLDINERTQAFLSGLVAQLMGSKCGCKVEKKAILPAEIEKISQNTEVNEEKVEPEPEKAEETEEVEKPLSEDAMVALRQKVVAFCQAGGDKNKALFAEWLKAHKLGRLTDITTAAMAAELEEVLSA